MVPKWHSLGVLDWRAVRARAVPHESPLECMQSIAFCIMNSMLAWVIETGLFGVAPLLLGRWTALGHRDCECRQISARDPTDPTVTWRQPEPASPRRTSRSWATQSAR